MVGGLAQRRNAIQAAIGRRRSSGTSRTIWESGDNADMPHLANDGPNRHEGRNPVTATELYLLLVREFKRYRGARAVAVSNPILGVRNAREERVAVVVMESGGANRRLPDAPAPCTLRNRACNELHRRPIPADTWRRTGSVRHPFVRDGMGVLRGNRCPRRAGRVVVCEESVECVHRTPERAYDRCGTRRRNHPPARLHISSRREVGPTYPDSFHLSLHGSVIAADVILRAVSQAGHVMKIERVNEKEGHEDIPIRGRRGAHTPH